MMLSVIPLAAIATMVYAKFVEQLSKDYQKELASSTEVASEALSNIRVVKTFPRGEAKAETRYSHHIDRSYAIGVKKSFGLGGFGWVVGIMIYVSMTGVVWYGAGLVLSGDMLPGTLMAFLFYSVGSIGGSVAGLSEVVSKLAETMGATAKVFEYMDREPQQQVSEEADYEPIICSGRLSFTEVRFHYPSRADIEVLKGVTFSVEPGQTMALVGRSGVGKSTCISLILRFYDPTAGMIAVDGRSLATLKDDCLRRNISLVAQEPVLFSTSIMDNIKYGTDGDVTREEVRVTRS
ncbi:multidrug resistance ABC transporter, putative [Perkinsus marinus ATCC 50983]|uniref:Multidrug resistance ABC transporter, putative n=1 Tax=Perkinsus marinus (strain ATCC 50983 / TXsc) TaxID=423536 RepID=C5L152_PERM5|nr:multidrug resistance ABC transporter, putative [Perkinsus marinus ATCC 50983]EER09541.1 multidrug resistance ABC transporter, putative [Perkinsus marinus ATCC 50983]|eukprot:XP_002777746.1 multidrug resistance ABC transporter, putative [Perkinsus marinus ATCC 50983]